jgi:hypothetical protein
MYSPYGTLHNPILNYYQYIVPNGTIKNHVKKD